jgi:hypothetical protein
MVESKKNTPFLQFLVGRIYWMTMPMLIHISLDEEYNLDAFKLFQWLDTEESGYVSWNRLLDGISLGGVQNVRCDMGAQTPIGRAIEIDDLEHCKVINNKDGVFRR